MSIILQILKLINKKENVFFSSHFEKLKFSTYQDYVHEVSNLHIHMHTYTCTQNVYSCIVQRGVILLSVSHVCVKYIIYNLISG